MPSSPGLTDSHAHLDSPRYDADREAMLKAALEAGVGTVLSIGIGDGPETMHRALDLCREYAGRTDVPRLYATAGVHPDEAATLDDAALDKLNKLLAAPEVIACGEIGLDYYWDTAPRAVQQEAFIEQMELRRRPLLAHRDPLPRRRARRHRRYCRMGRHTRPAGPPLATDRAWRDPALLRRHRRARKRAIDFGFLISFAGNITFPKAQAIRDAAQALPLASMLVETDAPFLSPVPRRGQRNEPAYVTVTAAKLAELAGVGVEELAAVTTRNFETLMRIAS